jgi:3-hydroxyisobutyrate dehydrogenase-like beta-hydroxyacid dehydrogenase
MQLGMIGLGRMGANMVRRLMRAGHECVAFDVSSAAVQQLADEGAIGAESLEDLIGKLEPPRAVWLMVPAAIVDQTLDSLVPLLAPRTLSWMAATPITATTSAGPLGSRSTVCSTWTSEPAAASGGWSAVTA